jgi:hypothetical protein
MRRKPKQGSQARGGNGRASAPVTKRRAHEPGHPHAHSQPPPLHAHRHPYLQAPDAFFTLQRTMGDREVFKLRTSNVVLLAQGSHFRL